MPAEEPVRDIARQLHNAVFKLSRESVLQELCPNLCSILTNINRLRENPQHHVELLLGLLHLLQDTDLSSENGHPNRSQQLFPVQRLPELNSIIGTFTTPQNLEQLALTNNPAQWKACFQAALPNATLCDKPSYLQFT